MPLFMSFRSKNQFLVTRRCPDSRKVFCDVNFESAHACSFDISRSYRVSLKVDGARHRYRESHRWQLVERLAASQQ